MALQTFIRKKLTERTNERIAFHWVERGNELWLYHLPRGFSVRGVEVTQGNFHTLQSFLYESPQVGPTNDLLSEVDDEVKMHIVNCALASYSTQLSHMASAQLFSAKEVLRESLAEHISGHQLGMTFVIPGNFSGYRVDSSNIKRKLLENRKDPVLQALLERLGLDRNSMAEILQNKYTELIREMMNSVSVR